MYKIEQTDYHYYSELTDFMNDLYEKGWEVAEIIDISASGDNKKMHRATILVKKRS